MPAEVERRKTLEEIRDRHVHVHRAGKRTVRTVDAAGQHDDRPLAGAPEQGVGNDQPRPRLIAQALEIRTVGNALPLRQVTARTPHYPPLGIGNADAQRIGYVRLLLAQKSQKGRRLHQARRRMAGHLLDHRVQRDVDLPDEAADILLQHPGVVLGLLLRLAQHILVILENHEGSQAEHQKIGNESAKPDEAPERPVKIHCAACGQTSSQSPRANSPMA